MTLPVLLNGRIPSSSSPVESSSHRHVGTGGKVLPVKQASGEGGGPSSGERGLAASGRPSGPGGASGGQVAQEAAQVVASADSLPVAVPVGPAKGRAAEKAALVVAINYGCGGGGGSRELAAQTLQDGRPEEATVD